MFDVLLQLHISNSRLCVHSLPHPWKAHITESVRVPGSLHRLQRLSVVTLLIPILLLYIERFSMLIIYILELLVAALESLFCIIFKLLLLLMIIHIISHLNPFITYSIIFIESLLAYISVTTHIISRIFRFYILWFRYLWLSIIQLLRSWVELIMELVADHGHFVTLVDNTSLKE
jgi:hypothetical protein